MVTLKYFSILGSIAIVISVSKTIAAKNYSKEAKPPAFIAGIPFDTILRDIKDLTKTKENNNTGGSESKKTLVGVKKHKNYEIVLYEYSEEDDVDLYKSSKEDKQSGSVGGGRSHSNNNNGLRSDRNKSKVKTKNSNAKNPSNKKGSKHADYSAEHENSAHEEEDSDESPFVWGQRENPKSQNESQTENLEGEFDKGRKDEEDGDHDIYPTNKWAQKKSLSAPGAGAWRPKQRFQTSGALSASASNLTESASEVDLEEVEADKTCTDPNGKIGTCKQYYKCFDLYISSNDQRKVNLEDYKCRLGKDEIGICCPLVEKQKFQGRTLMKITDMKKPLSPEIKRLVRSNVNNSIIYGTDSVLQLDEIELELLTRGGEVEKDSPAFGHNKFFPSSKRIRQVSEFGFELLQTTNDLSDKLQLTNELGGLGLKIINKENTQAIRDRCPKLAPCGINKYRLADGSCNNLRKPKMGQSLTPLSRVLEPAYADGRWEPRISKRGFLLPSARKLSETFIKDRNNPNPQYTLFLMQFGQFIDHDISSVPIFTFSNGTGISCCRNGNFLPVADRHPNCLPIEIPEDDPFYSRFSQRCMNFVRSRMAPRIDCSLGYADQMNGVTHWLDLSNVYGSSQSELRDLRTFQDGELEYSLLGDRKMLLPLKRPNSRVIDYKAGDDRVNEMQGLMVMHLVWLREHNRVAAELQKINPFWNDETLFQEARRIVIAEYQHIIYNEWLPIIVGREYMESYGIVPESGDNYFEGYDAEVDASIESAFSSAAFRMGHTLVQGIVRLINEFGQANEGVTISNHAENAARTRAPNSIDKWIRGLAQQNIQSFDNFITQHLNGRLFQARGGFFGMDLSALNIQRARDHGVAGYNAYRELCQTGSKATTFDEFQDWISPEIVEQMKQIYDHPDDVDLWIGGISEAPLKGALIGPTFTCIVGDQLARTKKGDRYFYDIGDQAHSFSPAQLQELRKARMARILCDNGDELEAIQPSVFLKSDADFNSLVDCKRSRRIPTVNLRLWENEPTP